VPSPKDQALVADIDTLLPRNHPEGVKWRVLAFPTRPDAPVLAVTRDDSVESQVVPCLCVSCEKPEILMSIAQALFKIGGRKMMVIHKLECPLSGAILIVPFLFDQEHKSREFIADAEMIMELLSQEEVAFSTRIIFCHVTIGRGDRKPVKPQDIPGAFDHDLRTFVIEPSGAKGYRD
jgi:hypothetical protein